MTTYIVAAGLASLLFLKGWAWALVAALLLADFAYVVFENRQAIATMRGGAEPTAANGFIAIPVFSVGAIVWEVFKAFFGFSRVLVSDAGGVIAASIGAVPGILASLQNPLVAALVFGLVGAGGGWIKGNSHGYTSAIRSANARADVAIKQVEDDARENLKRAIERANARADEAIKKATADAKAKKVAAVDTKKKR